MYNIQSFGVLGKIFLQIGKKIRKKDSGQNQGGREEKDKIGTSN